jgi:hypothetical protein
VRLGNVACAHPSSLLDIPFGSMMRTSDFPCRIVGAPRSCHAYWYNYYCCFFSSRPEWNWSGLRATMPSSNLVGFCALQNIILVWIFVANLLVPMMHSSRHRLRTLVLIVICFYDLPGLWLGFNSWFVMSF